MYEVIKAAEHLAKQIDENIRRLEEDLGAGSAKSFEEYRHMCGVRRSVRCGRRGIRE